MLRQFDGVEDVAVLGVPDAERGELVKAVVVPKGGKRFSRRAFDEFAREHLEVHKRPRVVEVVRGPLPRNHAREGAAAGAPRRAPGRPARRPQREAGRGRRGTHTGAEVTHA